MLEAVSHASLAPNVEEIDRAPFLAWPERGVLSVECNLVTSRHARD